MIRENERTLKQRANPEVHIKYEPKDQLGSHLVKNPSKKMYEYYKCDYCGGEIELKESSIEQTGGTIEFRGMKLALHNKCLKNMLKEYE